MSKANEMTKVCDFAIAFLKIITAKNLSFNDSKNDMTNDDDDVTEKNDVVNDEVVIVFRSIESFAAITFLILTKNFFSCADFR